MDDIIAREHERTERDTEGVGCDIVTKVTFSFRKSVSETSARITASI